MYICVYVYVHTNKHTHTHIWVPKLNKDILYKQENINQQT